ncbi:hypothetical protein ACWD95_35410 [Streptomyces sp. NPDC005069]
MTLQFAAGLEMHYLPGSPAARQPGSPDASNVVAAALASRVQRRPGPPGAVRCRPARPRTRSDRRAVRSEGIAEQFRQHPA